MTPRLDGTEGPLYLEISDFVWHSGETLVAVTFGRGMYECHPLRTVFVDRDNAFGEQDGTFFSPFYSVLGGYDFIGPGSDMQIAPGDYPDGGLVMDKRILI